LHELFAGQNEWLKWSLYVAAAAVLLPFVAGEVAWWTGLFKKDQDDVARGPAPARQAAPARRAFVAESSEDDFRKMTPDPQD
jgi:hypothetical protein